MIQTAIYAVAKMSSLKTLSAAQVQLISDALRLALLPPDGVHLYETNCASCHGPLASSTKKGASARKIKAAIRKNAGGSMGAVQLNNTQIWAIARALRKGAAAAALDSDCAACHPGGI